MSRKSDVMCPNGCDFKLQAPDYECDWHSWDCYRCGLDLPRLVDIDVKDLIEMWRNVELRPVLLAMLPELKERWGSVNARRTAEEDAKSDVQPDQECGTA
jgi:hypothetical protein